MVLLFLKENAQKNQFQQINEQKVWAQYVCDLTTPRLKDQRTIHTATAQ
jgi:hypothetical protein